MIPYATPADERFRARVRGWAERALASVDVDRAGDGEALRIVREMGGAGLLRTTFRVTLPLVLAELPIIFWLAIWGARPSITERMA